MLDVDKPETKPVLEQFDVRQRSTYLLIDADGNVLKAWVGYLDEATVASELEAILGQL